MRHILVQCDDPADPVTVSSLSFVLIFAAHLLFHLSKSPFQLSTSTCFIASNIISVLSVACKIVSCSQADITQMCSLSPYAGVRLSIITIILFTLSSS